MLLKATIIAAAATFATPVLAQPIQGQPQTQQQPQTPGDAKPKAQGEVPQNAQPMEERNTSMPGATGSRSGEGQSGGDRIGTKGTTK